MRRLEVNSVVVKDLAGAVAALGGSGVGITRGVLRVVERDPGVECIGDGRVSHKSGLT